jgi:hypothetical protein
MRWSVDAMVNSFTGAPTVPLLMRRPSAPVEKSPLMGFTPEWRPDTPRISTPSSISATSSAGVVGPGVRARARVPTCGVDEKPRTAEPVEAAPSRRPV